MLSLYRLTKFLLIEVNFWQTNKACFSSSNKLIATLVNNSINQTYDTNQSDETSRLHRTSQKLVLTLHQAFRASPSPGQNVTIPVSASGGANASI